MSSEHEDLSKPDHSLHGTSVPVESFPEQCTGISFLEERIWRSTTSDRTPLSLIIFWLELGGKLQSDAVTLPSIKYPDAWKSGPKR